MTELVILRCAVVSFIVWFFASEWFHKKQLDRAYQDGVRFALKKKIPEMQKAVDHFFQEFETDLRWIAEAVLKDEQSDAARVGEKRVSENTGDTN